MGLVGFRKIGGRSCRLFEATVKTREHQAQMGVQNHTECNWETHIVHCSTYLVRLTFNSNETNRISNRIW